MILGRVPLAGAEVRPHHGRAHRSRIQDRTWSIPGDGTGCEQTPASDVTAPYTDSRLDRRNWTPWGETASSRNAERLRVAGPFRSRGDRTSPLQITGLWHAAWHSYSAGWGTGGFECFPATRLGCSVHE